MSEAAYIGEIDAPTCEECGALMVHEGKGPLRCIMDHARAIGVEENQRWHDQLIKDNAKGHDDWLEAREAIQAVISRMAKHLAKKHPNNLHTIREQLQAQADAIPVERERVKRAQRGGRA